MFPRQRLPMALLTLVTALSFFGSPCAARNAFPQTVTLSAEEAALRLLIEQFFTAYTRKDLDGCFTLWSAKAPDLSARKQVLASTFAENEQIEVISLTIDKLKVESDHARAQVRVEMRAIATKTGKPSSDFGKMNRVLQFVKEDHWRIWRYGMPEDLLAVALIAAKTEEERAALLADEKDLLNVQFWKALLRTGERRQLEGEYAQAMAIYQIVQSLTENRLDDWEWLAVAWKDMGEVHRLQGNYDLSLKCTQKSLEISQKINNKRREANALNNFGNLYADLGDGTRALKYFQESLALCKEIGNQEDIATAFGNLGAAYFLLSDYDQALAYFKQGLAQKLETDDREGIGINLGNLGNIYMITGNYRQAFDYYQQGLKIKQEINDRSGIAGALENIGNVFLYQNDYDQALNYFQKGLQDYKEMGEKESISSTLYNIGGVYNAQNKYREALDYYQQSLKLSAEIGNEYLSALALNDLASISRRQGNYDQALDYAQRSFQLTEKLKDRSLVAMVLDVIALIHYYKRDYAQALQFAERAVTQAKQLGYREAIWDASLTKGLIYRALNRTEEARQAYDESIATIEALREEAAGDQQEQQNFFQGKLSPYQEMAEILAAQNKNAEALRYAERAKARVLLDVLESGRVKITKTMTEGEQKQERNLKNNLISLNSQITREKERSSLDPKRLDDLQAQRQKARLEREAFQIALYVAHPELKLRRGQTAPVEAAELAEMLADGNRALLEYVVTEDSTLLFVLTKGTVSQPDVKVYTLQIKQDDLTNRAESFRRQLAEHDLGFKAAAMQLYDLLLKPAQAQIAGKKELVIIPDDTLWQVPFQALQPAPGRYLLENSAISYAPSLSVLHEMTRRQKKDPAGTTTPRTLLAVGNPTIGNQMAEHLRAGRRGERLEALPEAEIEVKTLARLYGQQHSRVYVESEASENRIKAEAGSYDILHFATHAVLDDASPMYSHVVLSQAANNKDEDGLWEAWEMMNLDLKAKLVVLSACETARGRIGAGEGVIGMMWALFVAGCPATVVSQWNVDSASTTEMMLEFHRNLQAAGGKRSPMTKAEALRQAALKMMQDSRYRHPFYWASFIIVGDGS